jgi:hypothetical protein
MDTPAKRRSPLLYVGVGCGVLVVLVVGGVIVSGLWLASAVKETNDPATRDARVKAMLGATDLPAGYYPQTGFSLPMVMEMAILSDKPPPEEGIDKRGFVYFKFISKGQDQEQLRDYFSGKSEDPAVLKRNNINVDPKEIIRRGAFDSHGHPVLYLSQRGTAAAPTQGTGPGIARTGLNTMVLFQCKGEGQLRMGIWIGEDPHPDQPAKDADLTGTVADESQLRPFIGNFNPCEG